MNTRTTHTDARWLTWVTWLAILAPLPYGLSRLLWAAGVPFGIEPWLLEDLGAPGWGSAYILLLAVLSEGTGLFTHMFVLSRRATVPGWVPVLGGRPVRPAAVVAPLLLPIAILVLANAASTLVLLDGFQAPAGEAGLHGWSFWGQIAVFWLWGTSLAVATLAYWRVMRPRRPRRAPSLGQHA